MSLSRCSRVEHRLFGAIAHISLSTSRRGPSLDPGSGTARSERWRLTRCWVLRARALLDLGPRDRLQDPRHGRTAGITAEQAPRLTRGRPYFENYTVDASIFVAQVFKGTRWMPWHQEPKKDVGICDKPWGVDNQTAIQGFPNGETRLEASPVTPS